MSRTSGYWLSMGVLMSMGMGLSPAIAGETTTSPEQWGLFPAPVVSAGETGYSSKLRPVAVSQPPYIPRFNEPETTTNSTATTPPIRSAAAFPTPTGLPVESSGVQQPAAAVSPSTTPQSALADQSTPAQSVGVSADSFPTPNGIRGSISINQLPPAVSLLAAPVPPPPTLRPVVGAGAQNQEIVTAAPPPIPVVISPTVGFAPVPIAPIPASLSLGAFPSSVPSISVPSQSAPNRPTVLPLPINQLPVRATQATARNGAIVPIPAPPIAPPRNLAATGASRPPQLLPVPSSTIPIGYTGSNKLPAIVSPGTALPGVVITP